MKEVWTCNLYSARKTAGYTQEYLSKMTGIDRSTISQYEKGSALPSVTALCKLADTLQVSVGYLIGRK